MAPQCASGPTLFSRDHIPTIYIYAEYVPEFRGPHGTIPVSVLLGTLSRNWGQAKMKVEPDSCQIRAGDRRWTLPCLAGRRVFVWPCPAPLWVEEGTHKGSPYGQFFVHLHKILGVGTNMRLFWSRRSTSPDRHSPETAPSWLRIGPFRPPRQPPEASSRDAGNRSVPRREEPPC